jgi:polar amino acid transport system substrate-binding protein
MKKLVFFTLVISSILLASCAPASECPDCPECPPAGVQTDLGGREVRMAVEDAYPPFNYINDDGESVGWDYDVGRRICELLNCEAVFVVTAWEGLFEAMRAGENDVAFDGITIYLSRSLKIDYSDPYIEYGQVLVVRADEDRPAFADQDSFEDSDLIIGTQIGTTNEIAAIKLVGEDRIMSFETYDLPIVALMAGDVDTVIIDEVAAIGFIGANPGELKVAFSVTGGEYLALVFPPLSELTIPFNWALERMFEDGTMDDICYKWLYRSCSPK